MRWIWLLWVGVVMALALALLALWRPLPWTGVVYAGKWCCAQCSDAPPLKCTGCQTKEGACPLNAPTTLDCPGLYNPNADNGRWRGWRICDLLLKRTALRRAEGGWSDSPWPSIKSSRLTGVKWCQWQGRSHA